MAARCWETKRHREDMEGYQPCSRSLEMWDKGFASRKYAGTLWRFCQMLIKHVYSRAHQHNCGLSARRPNCVSVNPFIQKYITLQKYFRTFFFFYRLLPKLHIQIMYKIRHCPDTVQFKIDKLLSEKNRLTHPSLRPLIKKGKTFRRKKNLKKRTFKCHQMID